MMPVDEGKTSSAWHPNVFAAPAQVARAALMPASPAAQFALPALIATTRTRPPLALKFSLSIMSGAAMTRFDVNAAAALAGTIRNNQGKVHAAAGLHTGLYRAKSKAAGNDVMGEIAHTVNPI